MWNVSNRMLHRGNRLREIRKIKKLKLLCKLFFFSTRLRVSRVYRILITDTRTDALNPLIVYTRGLGLIELIDDGRPKDIFPEKTLQIRNQFKVFSYLYKVFILSVKFASSAIANTSFNVGRLRSFTITITIVRLMDTHSKFDNTFFVFFFHVPWSFIVFKRPVYKFS